MGGGDQAAGSEISAVLARLDAGEGAAVEELFPRVYDELRRLAAARLARLPPGQTLQPTALVHEAFIELTRGAPVGFRGRAHFFGVAARAMRDLAVDAARRKGAQKRGGGAERVALDEGAIAGLAGVSAEDAIALDRALARLRDAHPRQAEVAALRVFAGLSEAEIAEVHGVTARTVERDFRFARAFLARELSR